MRRALNDGGGILALGFASVTTASSISRNRANRNGGGVAALDQSSIHFASQAKLVHNDANVHGGGIYSAGLLATFGEQICASLD